MPTLQPHIGWYYTALPHHLTSVGKLHYVYMYILQNGLT